MDEGTESDSFDGSAKTSFGRTEIAGLRVRGSRDGPGTRLFLEGELDVAGAAVLLEYLRITNAGSSGEICLDLSDLDFVDSSGLSVLVNMHKRAQADGTKFTLAAPGKQFLRLLDITGLGDFFDLEA